MKTEKYNNEDIYQLIKGIQFKPIEADGDKIYEKVQQRKTRNVVIRKKVSWPVWISSAVACMLLVLSSWLYVERLKYPLISHSIEVRCVSGLKTRIILPDSTIVWLNGNSTLHYPSFFSDSCREVSFSGEAMFEVKSDPKKPFFVNIKNMKISVLGTKFNVYEDAAENVIETTLIEGSVALTYNGEEDEKVRLKPNQQARYDINNKKIDVSKVNALDYISWVNNSFTFSSETLEDIVERLQRGFQTKIHIIDPDLRKIKITGQFTHSETLDEILSIIQISANYSYKKEKGEIYLYKK